jgi:hypothetical protein
MTNPLPKIDLTTFFLSISSAAFMGLGVVPSPTGGAPQIDLELARQNIDLLELMYEKTRGNRSPEEDRLIDRLLFETRLKFVEKQKELKNSGIHD